MEGIVLKKANRMKNPRYIDLEPHKEEIIELYNKGFGFTKIATKYNVHADVITKRLYYWNVKLRPPKKRKKNKGYQKIPARFLSSAKEGAMRRRLNFNLSIKEIWILYLNQNGKCALTGEILTFDSHDNLSDGNASLDRKNNSKGYSKDNCQLITKEMNFFKNKFDDDKLFQTCETIINYRNERNKQKLVSRPNRQSRINVGHLRRPNISSRKRTPRRSRGVKKVSINGHFHSRKTGL